jgi:hypothetical protein
MRFFALVSSAFAIKEGQPTVPGTGASIPELLPELTQLYVELNVSNTLSGWATMVNETEKVGPEKHSKERQKLYLLVLNPETFSVEVSAFPRERMAEADARYAQIEKDSPNLQAVLVSADSVGALREAYPNYFFDTGEFLNELSALINIRP